MSIYTLNSTQKLPISLAKAWDFFSSPMNLKTITPDYMDFRVTTPDLAPKIYPGMIISYTVKPVMGIPLEWVTEITYAQEGVYFVDEQRFGPYALWHHKHFFKEIKNGVEMTDIVHYKMPFGWLGQLAHWLFVKRQLQGIFEYRTLKLDELFGKYAE